MELKKVHKQGRDETTQEDYPTSGVYFCRCRVVFLRCFISALFVYSSIPNLKSFYRNFFSLVYICFNTPGNGVGNKVPQGCFEQSCEGVMGEKVGHCLFVFFNFCASSPPKMGSIFYCLLYIISLMYEWTYKNRIKSKVGMKTH